MTYFFLRASPRKVQRSDAALTQKSPKPASQAQDKCGDCLTKQFKRVEFRWIGKAKKVNNFCPELF